MSVPSLGHTLRALRHRNFRLFFFGQLVSMTGTWMQGMAQMWLVYRLTHSALLLGLVGFAGQAPVLFLGLWGGLVADRGDRRRTLIWTQSAALVQAGILAALTYAGVVQVWHVFVLAFALGTVNAFDMPVRQSFFVEMVERPDLGNAIALNAFLVNASRMVGPALAGLLVGAYGEGLCFLLNAVSYLAVIAGLIMIVLPKPGPRPPDSAAQSWEHVKGGLRYVFSHRDMRDILALLALISVAGVPFMTLMPLISDGILHTGARGLGLLMAASGVGALTAALLLARRENPLGLMHLIGGACLTFGASLVLFAYSRSMALSLAIMLMTGWGMMTAFTGCNTLLQSLTADEMRGRVMALFSMTFMGAAPLGNLAAGFIARQVGAPATVAAGGCGVRAFGPAVSPALRGRPPEYRGGPGRAFARGGKRRMTARPGVWTAILAALAELSTGPVTRLGWWDFRAAFSIMRWAAYGGLAAAGLSLAGIAWSKRSAKSGVLGILAGLAVFGVPWLMLHGAKQYPPIHDVTTDTDDPPAFAAVLAARRGSANPAEYGGPEIASQQKEAYPDIRSLDSNLAAAPAFDRALVVAREMGWDILAASPSEGRLEATATTAWFGFKDDIVVRVRARGTGSLIDLRSLSRVGKGDAGMNAKRIRKFIVEFSGQK